MSFMIETSARHIHLTQETLEKLFGPCPIPASSPATSV